jgi:hypothetical protein
VQPQVPGISASGHDQTNFFDASRLAPKGRDSCRLPVRYIKLGYAAFMSEEAFRAISDKRDRPDIHAEGQRRLTPQSRKLRATRRRNRNAVLRLPIARGDRWTTPSRSAWRMSAPFSLA